MDKKLLIAILVLATILSAQSNTSTPTSTNSAVSQQTINDTLEKGVREISVFTKVSDIICGSLSNYLPAFHSVYAADEVRVTFTLSGLDSTFNGTVISIGGVKYTPSEFPLSFVWTQNSVHRVILTKSFPQGSGRMINLTNPVWEGLVGTYYTVPSTDKVINLNYVHLCLLSVNTVGLLSTYPSTVYINGVSIGTASDRYPINYWLQNTFTGTLSISSDITSLISRNYKFTKWKDDNSTATQRPLQMNEPQNLTAVYRTQWLVNIAPDSEIKGLVEPTGVLYLDPGTFIDINCSPKEGFFFTRWSTRGRILLVNNTQSVTRAFINGTGTISANFASTTVQIRIALRGVTYYNGPIITVDNQTYTYPELLTNNLFNWIAGSIHKVKATTELPIDNSTRYQFATWVSAILPDDQYVVPYENATFTALYRPLYYLRMNNGGYGTVRGEGWRLNGTTATISIEPTTVSVGTGVQYVFIRWASGSSKGYTGKNSTASLVLTEPLTETAIWEKQRVPLSEIGWTMLWTINIGVVVICVLAIAPWAISRLR